jgi:Na+/phosphate symporter
VKKSNLVLIGVGAVVAYLLYAKATAAAKAAAAAAGQAYTGSVNTVSDALSSIFGSAVTLPGTFYTAVFEDGTSHAIPANTVDANGNFTWTGYPAGSQLPQALQLTTINGTRYAISG